MNKLLIAFAVASVVSAGAALAQSEAPAMDEGLSMLEVAAAKEFAQLGITDVDPMALSLNQLAQIRSVLASSDYNVNEMKLQVESIIRNN